MAPIKVGVFPLLKNKPELVAKAKEVRSILSDHLVTFYDEGGAIGRRYRRQDELGTPYCVTVDFETLDDRAVTVRERDSMAQDRVGIDQLDRYLAERLT